MQRCRKPSGLEAGDVSLSAEKDDFTFATEESGESDSGTEIGEVCATNHADVLTVVDEFARDGVGK